jgi:predicted transcriptional regulator of viral defense system
MNSSSIGAPRRTRDAELALLAARQHGAVAVRQMLAIGIDRNAIAYRVRVGRLHKVLSRVYAVGHPALSRHGWVMAAVLAAGDGAVASHRSAAELHGIDVFGGGRLEVSAPRRIRPLSRVDVHGLAAATRRTRQSRIPVTTLACTLIDLADIVDEDQLVGAMREAQYRRRQVLEEVLRLEPDFVGRRGNITLRRAIERRLRGDGGARSESEIRFAT